MTREDELGPDYTYYGIIRNGEPKEDPAMVVRERVDDAGRSWAEVYTRDLRWEATSRLFAINSGRSDDDAEVITEDVVERFIARAIAASPVTPAAEQDP